MQQKTSTNLNLLPISELTAPCSIEPTPTHSTYLGKKTKRPTRLFFSSFEKGNQCSICLEFDYYSPSKCIQCTLCKSFCHPQCYIDRISNNINLNNFICQCCASKEKRKCSLCGEGHGMIKEIQQNFYSHVYCSKFFKEVHEEGLQIRKWRYRAVCKVCQNKKYESVPVIKCSNTKCKNYYHVQCAVDSGLIFNLGFQKDFFAISNDNDTFPFYCNYHNKNLIREYEYYIKQMDQVLEANDKEEVTNSKVTEIGDETEEITTNPKESKEEVSHSNINLNNKEDFLKVNFDYDNKNISNENALNADFTIDDIDIFKGFEPGIKKNENLFNSFNMDYF